MGNNFSLIAGEGAMHCLENIAINPETSNNLKIGITVSLIGLLATAIVCDTIKHCYDKKYSSK